MQSLMKTVRAIVLLLFLLCLAACAGRQEVAVDRGLTDVEIVTALAGYAWVAEYIHGAPVVDMSHISMVFSTDGLVKGSGGCNVYSGGYTLKDGSISFGPLASTMKMCTKAVVDQETRFFQSLEEPQAVTFENGLLHLTPAGGKPSVFAVQE